MTDEKGFSLVETLVALSIMSFVAVAFLSGLSTSSKAVVTNQEQITAESLAKSQMEYIKRQCYRVDLQYNELASDQIPTGYDIEITPAYIDPRGDGSTNDDGLQKIVITISRDAETVFTLEGYKYFIGQ